MSYYSKISLFALLASGSLIGMEQPPRLKHPETSAAAQALNQPMIKVFSETDQIDSIQRNYLEASEPLKNMLADTGAEHALVLPQPMIEDYAAIKDLLQYEYRFKMETTDEKTVADILKPRTEQQLVAITNACQRFALNKVSECAVIVLAEKLTIPAHKEKCLQTGSFNLNWTPDVAHLIAKEMYKDNKIFYMTLTDLTARKQGKISFWHTSGNNTTGQEWTTYNDFIGRHSEHFHHKNFCKLLMSKFYWIYEHPEFIDLAFHALQNDPTILVNRVHIDINIFGALIGTKISTLYWQIDPEIVKIANNLKPEQVTILIEYYNRTDGMPAHLREKLPQQIRQLLFPNWWQRRSWVSKAAILAGGAAATGLAAWYGYKYFSKK